MAEAGKPMTVAHAARAALLDMAKDNVPATPDNYQRYFSRHAELPQPKREATLRDWRDRLIAQGSAKTQAIEDALLGVIEGRGWAALDGCAQPPVPAQPPPSAPVAAVAPGAGRELQQQMQAVNNVIYVMESFTRNLQSLLPDHPVVAGQVEIVRDLLENPFDRDRLFSAKRALSRAMTEPDVQERLRVAKAQAQEMAQAFLAGMGSAGAEAGTFCEQVEQHRRAVEAATTPQDLAQATRALLSSADASRSRMQESHSSMTATMAKAQQAEVEIKGIEHNLQQAAEQAKKNYLSSMMDRRSMNEELDKVFNSAISKISIALLDIDNFKRSQDASTQTSDEALNHLAAAIEECVAGKGVPSRMGPEEFLILFDGYDAEQVREEMEKLQRTLTKKFFLQNDSRMVITFSAGIAQRMEGELPSEAIMRADDAMHSAKSKGKNRVEIAWGEN